MRNGRCSSDCSAKIAIVVSHLGELSSVFIWRHTLGLSKLSPIMLTLGSSNENIYPYPPAEILTSSNALMRHLATILWRACYFWDESICKRPYIWRSVYVEAGHRFRNAIRKHSPNLVLVHFANMATSLISQLERMAIPLVVICHGNGINRAHLHRPYLKKLRRVFARADRLIFVSEYLRRRGLHLGCPREKAEVFYLGASVPKELPPRCERDKSLLRFVMTARFVPLKGHLFVLDAFAVLLSKNVRAELVLLGDGPLRLGLENQARSLGIQDKVRFAGAVSNKKVYEELAISDVYLQPSLIMPNGETEGLGLGLVEAMAWGLPCIGTSVGGIPEAISDGESGILVPPRNTDALAEAMLKLANDDALRSRMGSAAREIALERFDVEKQNEKFVSMLSQMIGEKSL